MQKLSVRPINDKCYSCQHLNVIILCANNELCVFNNFSNNSSKGSDFKTAHLQLKQQNNTQCAAYFYHREKEVESEGETERSEIQRSFFHMLDT